MGIDAVTLQEPDERRLSRLVLFPVVSKPSGGPHQIPLIQNSHSLCDITPCTPPQHRLSYLSPDHIPAENCGEVVDANGHVVFPNFIDIQSYAILPLNRIEL